MLYETKEAKGKDAGSVWQLVYGKIQHKNNLPTIKIGIIERALLLHQRDGCTLYAMGA